MCIEERVVYNGLRSELLSKRILGIADVRHHSSVERKPLCELLPTFWAIRTRRKYTNAMLAEDLSVLIEISQVLDTMCASISEISNDDCRM
jgi:hypothetical protein